MKKRLDYPDFVGFVNKYDVFCVSETHTDSNDITDIEGFTYFPKHRTQRYLRKSGGIGIYVRDYIAPFVTIRKNNSEYVLWIVFDKHFLALDEPILLGAIYVPPENSRFFSEELWNEFENEISEILSDNKYVYIAGDTNGRVGTLRDFIITDQHFHDFFEIDESIRSQLDKHVLLENLSIPLERCSRDSRTNTHGYRLIEALRNNNLFLLNGRLFQDKNKGMFTFKDKSVIDYVLATAECFDYIVDFNIIETDALFSDGHNVLYWEIAVPTRNSRKIETIFHSNYPVWKSDLSRSFRSNIDTDAVKELSEHLSNSPSSPSVVDSVTDELQFIFHDAAKRTFPDNLKTSYTYKLTTNKPWFGPKCNLARRNYHDAKCSYNDNPTDETKIRLKNASKAYKRTMNFYIKKHKQTNEAKLRSLNEKNPKKYWKFLNRLKPKSKSIQSPSVQDFFNHFKTINTNTILDNRFDEDFISQQDINEVLNRPINEQEIIKAISGLQNSKTPSPSDNILNEYIKETADLLLPLYCRLFNAVLDSGHLPQTWLEGTIIPIYKNKGDPTDPNSYRPITILSCLGKLFTSILNSRLTTYLDENNLMDQNQAGFRKGYSCSDHIFTLSSLIEIVRKKET